jgi:hypothetical protein
METDPPPSAVKVMSMLFITSSQKMRRTSIDSVRRSVASTERPPPSMAGQRKSCTLTLPSTEPICVPVVMSPNDSVASWLSRSPSSGSA